MIGPNDAARAFRPPRTHCGRCHSRAFGLPERWRVALQAWSDGPTRDKAWRYLGPVVAIAPTTLLQEISYAVSRWLQVNAKTIDVHVPAFLIIARRILDLQYDESKDRDDPVTQAINHPIGHVTEALLDWWYRRELKDGQGLPEELRQFFTIVCNVEIEKFRHARVLLATHVIALFRVDPLWAVPNVLPLFDWQRSHVEAKAAWEGFLWSPRLFRPLLEQIRRPFLETAQHYGELGEHKEQYAGILTYAALEPGDTFTRSELALATRALPQDGLDNAADALTRAIEGAGPQQRDYWKNRVQPYIKAVWPKDRNRVTASISESFARACIAAGGELPGGI